MDVQRPTEMTHFTNTDNPIDFPCACLGPQGNDPLCPCQMRQAGLEPHNPWTPEKVKELEDALAKVFQWEK